MKQTPFHELHESLGAKLVEFGGYAMPVQYTGIIEEHLAVRSRVGVFDVAHMGEIEVRGRDALNFLQHTTVNDVSKLKPGKAQYSAMCYDDGGIVDDLLVYHCGDYYMLVVNASNIQKDFEWLQSHVEGDVLLRDASDETALLAVQGPQSLKTLQKLTETDLGKVEYYTFVRGSIASVPMLISRTGYTGELGFEIYFAADKETCAKVWKEIFTAGEEFGILPAGLGARDTLRLEMGFCLYGNDIDQTTHPLEANLGWITKIDKGEFIGRPALLRAKQDGILRRLVGFKLSERAVARHDYPLKVNGTQVGHVTSGTFSPSLQHAIGLGYVKSENAKIGSEIRVEIRGKEIPASVVKLPFLQKSPAEH